MDNITAFKNELRNYLYYKTELKVCVADLNKLPKCDDEMDKYKILRYYNKALIQLEHNLDGTFTQLTGFKAIRYDVEPSAYNEHLSDEMKLELIDKYELQLIEFRDGLKKAEKRLNDKIKWLKEAINEIEFVLLQLPNDIREVCVDIYCRNKKYEDVSNGNNVYWSPSGLYWNVNKELERVLKSEG